MSVIMKISLILLVVLGATSCLLAQSDTAQSKDLGAFVFTGSLGYVHYLDPDWKDYDEQVMYGGSFMFRLPDHQYWIDAGLSFSMDGSKPDSLGDGVSVFAPNYMNSGSVVAIFAGIGNVWTFADSVMSTGAAIGVQYAYSHYMSDWNTGSSDKRHHIGLYGRLWHAFRLGGLFSLGPYASGSLTTEQNRRGILLNASNVSFGLVLALGPADFFTR